MPIIIARASSLNKGEEDGSSEIGHNWGDGKNLFEIGGWGLGWWAINDFASTFLTLIILYVLQF